MNKEFEPRSAGAAAAFDQTRASGSGDLQYVSLQVGGKAYGGWYRLLPDGRLELLALANVQCERRFERTPIEQARAMLADVVRSTGVTEPRPVDSSTVTGQDGRNPPQPTLGDLLYADKTKFRIPEAEWVGLVRAIADGDRLALDRLFQRTQRIVFTLMMRLIGNREVAEELMLEVYHGVWREASRFDPAGGPVLSWLLNRTRLKALQRLQRDQQSSSQIAGDGTRLRSAVADLLPQERRAIETVYFSGLTYRELAARNQQLPEAIRGHIHSGLEKLRTKFGAGAAEQ